MTEKETDTRLEELNQQRWEDFENGIPEYNPSFPEEPVKTVPDGLDPISSEFFSYYRLERGHNPNARGRFTTTSSLSFHYFSEDAYESASEPKELYIVPDAIHIDLYDQVDKIPFDKIESFFK